MSSPIAAGGGTAAADLGGRYGGTLRDGTDPFGPSAGSVSAAGHCAADTVVAAAADPSRCKHVVVVGSGVVAAAGCDGGAGCSRGTRRHCGSRGWLSGPSCQLLSAAVACQPLAVVELRIHRFH